MTNKNESDSGKDPAAVALGRKGGIKGGPARANKLTPEERRESASKAGRARWEKERAGKENSENQLSETEQLEEDLK